MNPLARDGEHSVDLGTMKVQGRVFDFAQGTVRTYERVINVGDVIRHNALLSLLEQRGSATPANDKAD